MELLFILSAFFFMVAVVFLVSAAVVRRDAEWFSSEMRRGRAVVEGYRRKERSSWYTLLVRLPEVGDGKQVYECSAGKIRTADYPKGKIVEVYYAKRKQMGLNTVRIVLEENRPTDGMVVAKVFRLIGIAGILLGGILCGAAIIKLL